MALLAKILCITQKLDNLETKLWSWNNFSSQAIFCTSVIFRSDKHDITGSRAMWSFFPFYQLPSIFHSFVLILCRFSKTITFNEKRFHQSMDITKNQNPFHLTSFFPIHFNNQRTRAAPGMLKGVFEIGFGWCFAGSMYTQMLDQFICCLQTFLTTTT